MSDKRVTMQIDLPADVQTRLRDFCKRGRIQKDVVAQVLRWFMGQPGPVKRVVLEDVDDEMKEDYARFLEASAKKVRLVPIRGDTEGGRPPWEPDPAHPTPKLPVEFTDEREPAGANAAAPPAPPGATTGQAVVADLEAIEPVAASRPARKRRGQRSKKRQPSER